MRSIKLYGTGLATGNAVAQVTIPSKGRIVGVQFAASIDSVTDGASLNIEVSRASAREIAVNGAQQCVAEINVYGNFVTSGLAQGGVNQFFPVDVDVDQGQIIYLHAVVAGTLNYFATVILWIK